ncbi:unnamed protein product [Ceutorhynchus assimilis]|uniref:Ankyrin repeat domain-containing protein 16 n=1 Tax=Ceutorhynchus assimilis TaxID=467358 RepID=A0A9N9MVD4_9CUCU|nr:unnamed protein product [Ceutorhynchus assimilis]
MASLKLNKKLQEKILKEVQHGDISTLQSFNLENPCFHWSSISYEKTGDTILHVAARLGYVTIIHYLLDEFYPCAVNVRNKDDKTALHEAAQFAQLQSILKLCSFRADVNALRRGDWTALMLACTKVQSESNLLIAKALVKRGAQVNLPNKDGWTCVHILAREGGEDIFDYLLEHGLQVNVKTKNGRTPLHIAALHGNIGFISKLITYIDIDSKDSCGNTPLHEAILGQHIKIAAVLVELGADTYAKNNSDLSVLHLAASQNSLQVINYILSELNGEINFQNKNGWTVAHCAARKGLREICEHLKTLGADLSIKDNFGRSATDYLSS